MSPSFIRMSVAGYEQSGDGFQIRPLNYKRHEEKCKLK